MPSHECRESGATAVVVILNIALSGIPGGYDPSPSLR
jgi:hypothetical protein